MTMHPYSTLFALARNRQTRDQLPGQGNSHPDDATDQKQSEQATQESRDSHLPSSPNAPAPPCAPAVTPRTPRARESDQDNRHGAGNSREQAEVQLRPLSQQHDLAPHHDTNRADTLIPIQSVLSHFAGQCNSAIGDFQRSNKT